MTTSPEPITIENPPPYEDVNSWVLYYFKIWGCNVIPAPVSDKNKPKKEQESFWPVKWEDYPNVRISDQNQQRWIDACEYTKPARGIAIILGRVWVGRMSGKWLVGIDADNQKGIELVCKMFGCATVEEVALKGVVVEQHIEDAPHKAHFYFYSDTPFHNLPGIKTRYTGDKTKDWAKLAEENKVSAIEIKCAGGGVHFATPSKHSGGYTYKQVAGSPPAPRFWLNETEAADSITKLEDLLNEFGDSYIDYKSKTTGKTIYPSIEEMYRPDYKVPAGSNRHLECRRLGAKLLIKCKMVNLEQSLSEVLKWNSEHDVPPLDNDDVTNGFYQYSIPKAEKWLKERQDQKARIEEMVRKTEEAKKAVASMSTPKATTKTPTATTNAGGVGGGSSINNPLLAKYNNDYYEYLLDYNSKSVKEENTLLRQILLTILSAQTQGLANNLHLRAPSSEGKSFPVMKTVRACNADPNEIIVINHMTPTALIYQSGGVLVDKNGIDIGDKVKELKKQIKIASKSKNLDLELASRDKLDELLDGSAYRLDLTGKCFALVEPPKEGLWDLLKAILSHDSFELKHMMTDKGMTGMKTKTVILRGWPAFIYCSAKDETHSPVWEEVLTRFMTSAPNMVPKKYYEGNKIIARNMGLPGFAARRTQVFGTSEERQLAAQCYQQLKNQIRSYCSTPDSTPVWIPFLEQISDLLPQARGADNRVTSRIFQLLIIITLARAHLHHTMVDTVTGQRCVIATFADLREALHVTQNVSGLAPHKERFYFNIIMKLYYKKAKEIEELRKKNPKLKSNTEIFFTSTEIAEAYNETVPQGGRRYNADGITNAYLDELHNRSYIEKIQDPRTNRIQYVYYPIVGVSEEEVSAAESQQVGATFWTYSGNNGKNLQFRKLLLPNNHKGFDKDWLKVQFEQDFGCRIEQATVKIYDQYGKEISIADYIAGYEAPELSLKHFYKTVNVQTRSQPSACNGTKKEAEIEETTIGRPGALVKIITEGIKIKETAPLSDKYGQSVTVNTPPAGGAGVASTTTTTTTTPSSYTPLQPAQQRQMLLVEAYELEQQERAKINNETKTLQLLAQQRQRIPKELVPLYSESVSIDTEWVEEDEGRESKGSTIRRLYALSFVDWKGIEKVFHVEDYKDGSIFERTRAMLNDAFSYWFNNYRLSFGFNSYGKGSDREVIFENAQHYNTTIQPVEEVVIGQHQNRRTYYRFKERELKHTHIDWYLIFKNKAVHNYIFEQKYREFGLNAISKALFDVGKYKEADGLEANQKLSVDEQKQYVLQDSRVLSLLSMAEDGNLLGAMQYIADLLELPLPQVCHSQVSRYWTVLYQKAGYEPPALVEKENPETHEIEKVGRHYYFKSKVSIPVRGKNKGVEQVKVISPYTGGRVLDPTPGFYKDVIGLDQESQYPTISVLTNVGFETMCCEHQECSQDPTCQIKDTGDPEIDSAGYYICKLQGDSIYKQKLMIYRKARIEAKEKDERVKDLALKIIINGAYGVYGYKKFPFGDTRVASVITAYGRKMHKAMEDLAKSEPYKFNVIGGDTDSILITYPSGEHGSYDIELFCQEFKNRYAITVKPSKKVWSKMLITKKKHYIYWEQGNEDNPIIKGMEAAKNNMPRLTNIIFSQFVRNIGADRILSLICAKHGQKNTHTVRSTSPSYY
jgi:DNA polymerase elongation subunit (family B)